MINTMPVLLDILSILVFASIIFVWGVRYNNIKDEFKHFNLPTWVRDMVGIFKFSFAIMLFNDNPEVVRIGALGIAVLMIAALFTHIRLKSTPPKMLPSFFLLCTCLAIAYMSAQLHLAG
jgi:ABC-type transport system involved in multi-copper enzyme maturation permease subunit